MGEGKAPPPAPHDRALRLLAGGAVLAALVALVLDFRGEAPRAEERHQEALPSNGSLAGPASATATARGQQRQKPQVKTAAKSAGQRGDLIKKACEAFVMKHRQQRCKTALASPEFVKRFAWSERTMKSLRTGGGDVVSRICFQTAFFKEDGAGFAVLTDENVAAYMAACREAFPTAGEEVRRRLRQLLHGGLLHRKLFQYFRPAPRANPRTCGAFWQQKGPKEVPTLADQAEFERAGVWPLRERTIALLEVQTAFARSEVARVDVRSVLPKGVLNMTLRELRDLNADVAGSTVFNSAAQYRSSPFEGGVDRCHHPLVALIDRFRTGDPDDELVQVGLRALIPWVLEQECLPIVTLADVARASANFHKSLIPYSHLREQSEEPTRIFRQYRSQNRSIFSSAINALRLEPFKHMDVSRHLGLSASVERAHVHVRFGVNQKSIFHSDAFDNILMQITDEVDVIMIPGNCSVLAADMPYDAGILDWATRGLPKGRSRAPFFHIRLRPGEGVTIPSGTVHNVFSRNPRRVGLSSFLEPKFGRMQWPSAPSNHYGRNDKDVLAARSLWTLSTRRLWERRGIGMFFHTPRLEIL